MLEGSNRRTPTESQEFFIQMEHFKPERFFLLYVFFFNVYWWFFLLKGSLLANSIIILLVCVQDYKEVCCSSHTGKLPLWNLWNCAILRDLLKGALMIPLRGMWDLWVARRFILCTCWVEIVLLSPETVPQQGSGSSCLGCPGIAGTETLASASHGKLRRQNVFCAVLTGRGTAL